MNICNRNFPLKEKRGHRYQFGHLELVGVSLLPCFTVSFVIPFPYKK